MKYRPTGDLFSCMPISRGRTLIKSKNSRIPPSVLCPRSGGRIGGPRGSPVLLPTEANVMHSPRDPCNTRSSITWGEDSTPGGGRPAQHTQDRTLHSLRIT